MRNASLSAALTVAQNTAYLINGLADQQSKAETNLLIAKIDREFASIISLSGIVRPNSDSTESVSSASAIDERPKSPRSSSGRTDGLMECFRSVPWTTFATLSVVAMSSDIVTLPIISRAPRPSPEAFSPHEDGPEVITAVSFERFQDEARSKAPSNASLDDGHGAQVLDQTP